MSYTWIETKEHSRLLRAWLKAKFPGKSFSVVRPRPYFLKTTSVDFDSDSVRDILSDWSVSDSVAEKRGAYVYVYRYMYRGVDPETGRTVIWSSDAALIDAEKVCVAAITIFT